MPNIFVGADGCHAGWFAVAIREDGKWETGVFEDVESLWKKYRRASVILLDIPIGLRDGGTLERLCDKRARKLLGGKRGSAVFPAPCRKATRERAYREASRANKDTTGRGLSRQTWSIIPKIKEVDELLSQDNSARRRVREIHPEICFWALACHPMQHSKKTREGYLERMEVLRSVYPRTDELLTDALAKCRRKDVARDDILDALSAAVTATVGKEKLVSLPEPPERDSRGLPMQMVYRPYCIE